MKTKLIIVAAMIFFACHAAAQSDVITDKNSKDGEIDKLEDACNIIASMYPDNIDQKKLKEKVLRMLLEQLDPHSTYKSKDELDVPYMPRNTIESGTGAELKFFMDTLTIVSVEPKSTAEKAGLKLGLQIDSINNEAVTNRKLCNIAVKSIIDKRTDSVSLGVMKGKGVKNIVVPMSKFTEKSVIAHYSPNDSTTYIKIIRFTKTTPEEFDMVLEESGRKRIRNIILDLRDNVGGSLLACKKVCDQILPQNQCIFNVSYSQNASESFFAAKEGRLKQSRIIVIINEYSASASEILAASIQDHDRGVIIGRRSFGKGLTQKVKTYADGSRLTVSNGRITMPSHRCIQKPYIPNHFDEYYKEIETRRLHKEHLYADSIRKNPSKAFKTLDKQRTVYGEMGVVPDLFVPEDSSNISFRRLDSVICKKIDNFAYEYVNANRATLASTYKNFETFLSTFNPSSINSPEIAQYQKSSRHKLSLKAGIAKAMFGFNKFWQLLNHYDADYNTALRLIATPQAYRKILE